MYKMDEDPYRTGSMSRKGLGGGGSSILGVGKRQD